MVLLGIVRIVLNPYGEKKMKNEYKLEQKRYLVKIRGIKKLLMHKFVPQIGKGKKQVYEAEKEAEKGVYRNSEGKIYFPSSWFESTMIKMSTEFKMQGKKTYKEYIKGGIIIEPEEIIADNQEYEIFECPVVINRSKVVAWRPMFKDWSCQFEIVNNDPVNLDTTTLKEILMSAGRLKGVGDWRPKYGQFVVEKFNEIK